MVEALSQKSRAGGFPPPLLVIFSQEKLSAKQQPVASKSICNVLASQGAVSLAGIHCL